MQAYLTFNYEEAIKHLDKHLIKKENDTDRVAQRLMERCKAGKADIIQQQKAAARAAKAAARAAKLAAKEEARLAKQARLEMRSAASSRASNRTSTPPPGTKKPSLGSTTGVRLPIGKPT